MLPLVSHVAICRPFLATRVCTTRVALTAIAVVFTLALLSVVHQGAALISRLYAGAPQPRERVLNVVHQGAALISRLHAGAPQPSAQLLGAPRDLVPRPRRQQPIHRHVSFSLT